jgi:hypothetical protein
MRRNFSLHKSWPLLLLLIAFAGCSSVASSGPEIEARKAGQERYAKAKALFEERCKTAGVVIKRTVKDVEGIELTKIRQPIPWGGREYFDPMYPEAAMAGEHRGDDYIKQFLMTEFRMPAQPNVRGGLGPRLGKRYQPTLPPLHGYAFVEYSDAKDGTRFRCVPTWTPDQNNWVPGQHRCDKVNTTKTRYALDYEDLVDPSDRALWVAGTKLKVIDKQNNEVIAELTRYVWDAGFGISTTGRWPWSYAATSGRTECIHAPGIKSEISRFFVDTVLQPKQGE